MRPSRRNLLATIGAGIFRGRRAAATAPLVVVDKAESCDCCDAWVQHLRSPGLHVVSHHSDDLPAMGRRSGVPRELEFCLTAFVDNYVIECHVPPASMASSRRATGRYPGLCGAWHAGRLPQAWSRPEAVQAKPTLTGFSQLEIRHAAMERPLRRTYHHPTNWLRLVADEHLARGSSAETGRSSVVMPRTRQSRPRNSVLGHRARTGFEW
jgi:hypothetical protein